MDAAEPWHLLRRTQNWFVWGSPNAPIWSAEKPAARYDSNWSNAKQHTTNTNELERQKFMLAPK